MEFFGRENEIAALRRIRDASHEWAKFTVLTGRRRVGKTELVKQALNDGADTFVYLLVTRQNERTLCETLQSEVEYQLGVPILGRATGIAEILRVVLRVAEARPVTLVIDEFQEFDRVNPAIFGEVQKVWDEFHRRSKVNFVVCGSVTRLMKKVFFDKAEPLYGRNTGHLKIEPFPVSLLKRIFETVKPNFSREDLLALWTITGGVARYVQLLLDDKAYTKRAMVRSVFAMASPFLDEGRILLAEEFGGEYATFFSVLSEIASGKTTFGELAATVGSDVGTYLARLERDYGIIRRQIPICGRENSRNSAYRIDDCFLRFWFRFVFKYGGWIELGRVNDLEKLVLRDFDVFSGYALERYFFRKFAETGTYTKMGGWWDRKGENEIDLVCEDEVANRMDFYEVKKNASRYIPSLLESKVEAFFEKHPQKRALDHSVGVLSLEDM